MDPMPFHDISIRSNDNLDLVVIFCTSLLSAGDPIESIRT